MDFKERIKQALDITHCKHTSLNICKTCSNNLTKVQKHVENQIYWKEYYKETER